jgi:hypothetical protein
MAKRKGGIHIPPDIKPFPKLHELETARVLANGGFMVEFLQPDNRKGAKTPDVQLNGEFYELKSPLGKMDSIERNLKRAVRQSDNIVFDCRRMKVNNNDAIERTLVKKLATQKQIKNLIFINKYGKIVDINRKL